MRNFPIILMLAALLCMPLSAQAQDSVAEAVKKQVNTSTLVEYTTGINPDDYPCAKAGIAHIYAKRAELADMSAFHPKRIIAWVVDSSIYYTHRFVDFLKSLMNPNAVANGIRSVHNMVTSGTNPLASLDRKVSGWVDDLSPSSQYALQRKVKDVIENTTNADGSCKG